MVDINYLKLFYKKIYFPRVFIHSFIYVIQTCLFYTLVYNPILCYLFNQFSFIRCLSFYQFFAIYKAL